MDVLEAAGIPPDRDQVQALVVLDVVLGHRVPIRAVDRERDGDVASGRGLLLGELEGVAVLGDHESSWDVRSGSLGR